MITTGYVAKNSAIEDKTLAYELPSQTPATFVVIDHGEHFLLRILDNNGGEIIDEVDIPKPSFIRVDQSNWAQYIDYTIDTQGTSVEHSRHKYKKLTLENGVVLMSRRSIGLITFQLKPHDLRSYRITTVEKKPHFKGAKLIVPYKVFDSKFETALSYMHITVDLDGLNFTPTSVKYSVVYDTYKLPFTKDISITTLYLASHHKGPLAKSQIWKLTQDQKGINSFGPNMMVWNSIGAFHYLESRDGKFKIVFHEKLEEPTIDLIREALLLAIPKEEVKGLYGTLRHTNSVNSLDSVFKFIEKIKGR